MSLFLKAAHQIINNWQVTLRMSVGLILLILAWVISFALYMPDSDILAANMEDFPFILNFMSIGLAIVGAAMFCSIAVSWHRYILCDELPRSMLFPGKKGLTWPYFWGTLKVGLFSIVVMIIPLIVFTIFIEFFAPNMYNPDASPSAGSLILAGIIAVVIFAFFYTIIFRASISLTSIAMQVPLGIRQSLEMTKAYFNQVLVATIIILVINQFIEILPQLFTLSTGSDGLVVSAVATILSVIGYWFSSFLGIGIVTVIYGHAVEGREL